MDLNNMYSFVVKPVTDTQSQVYMLRIFLILLILKVLKSLCKNRTPGSKNKGTSKKIENTK